MKKRIGKCYEKLHAQSNRDRFCELLAKEFSRDLKTTIKERWMGKDFNVPKKYQPQVFNLLSKFHKIQKESDLKIASLLSGRNA